ncbi:MAG: glycosyltransferase family 4 protein, partial [Acidimicrobiales bacterium]
GDAPEPYQPTVPMRHHGLPRPLLYETWQRVHWPSPDRLVPDADLLHATTTVVPPTKKPLVVTVHDLAFLHFPGLFTSRGTRIMTRGFRDCIDHADLVCCSSQATFDDCAARGISLDRLRLVPLGIDTQPVSESAINEVRSRLEVVRPYIFWNGTVEPRKNLAGLLKAYALVVSDVDLVLAGPVGWQDSLDEHLEALGSKRNRVRRLGFVSSHDRDALHAGAEVFCFPSLYEGFGFPVLEALAQGTPVVTSRGTSTEELLGDAGELVDPDNPEDIAAGIETLLVDEDRRRDAISAASVQVERFSWDRCIELTLRAYRELVV